MTRAIHNRRNWSLAVVVALSVMVSADTSYEGDAVSLESDLAVQPARISLSSNYRRAPGVVLLDEQPVSNQRNYTQIVAEVVRSMKGTSTPLHDALLRAVESTALRGNFSNHREYLSKLEAHICPGAGKQLCAQLGQLVEYPGPATKPRGDSHPGKVQQYSESVGELATYFCGKQHSVAQLCAQSKHLSRSLQAGLKAGDLSGFKQGLLRMQLQSCATPAQSTDKVCKVLSLLSHEAPKRFGSMRAAQFTPQQQKPRAEAHKAVASVKHLTKAQREFPGLIVQYTHGVCGTQQSSFCTELQRLPAVYKQALARQDKKIFLKKLISIGQESCVDPETLVGPNCQVLVALREKLPSLAHLGADGISRLTHLHQEYLKTTMDIWKSYCHKKKDSTIFCQLCRGLERTYRLALRAQTNHRYERYLTAMNDRFCAFAQAGNQTSRRCQILPILRKEMPISTTTLFALPELHNDFISTIDDAMGHFCSKHPNSLTCELFHGTQRLYIQSVNQESNHVVEKYIMTAQSEFCELQNNTKRCRVFTTLRDGLPPAFNAEGLQREVEGQNVQGKTAQGQALLKQALKKDRADYGQAIAHVRQDYCKRDARSYFCQVAAGLMANYQHSIKTSHVNGEYNAYLSKAQESQCDTLEGKKSRRCRILDVLQENLPMSVKQENWLLNHQKQYAETLQDVTKHYCHNAEFTVFCQLTHGLIRHYLNALVKRSNSGLEAYLERVILHQCVRQSGNYKQCQVLKVLKRDIPREGTKSRVKVQKAEVAYTQSKAALQDAEKTQEEAEKSVKEHPSAIKLQALQDDSSQEARAEHSTEKKREKLIDELSKTDFNAPSETEVRILKKEERKASKNAVLSVEHLSNVQQRTQAEVSELKKKSAEAKLKFATATTAVESDPSEANVEAVKKALSIRAKVALSLTQAVKEEQQTVSKAKKAVEDNDKAVEELRTQAKVSNMKRKTAVAKEAVRQAKRDTTKSKIAMLLAEVELERAKEAKESSVDPMTPSQANYAELSEAFKRSEQSFQQQTMKQQQVTVREEAIMKEARDQKAVLATQKKLDDEKSAADAASQKKDMANGAERDQKLILRRSMEAQELATKKKAGALTKELGAKKAKAQAQADIVKADDKIKSVQLRAEEASNTANELKLNAETLEKKVDAEKENISNVTSSMEDLLEKGQFDLSRAKNDEEAQKSAVRAAREEEASTEKAKVQAEADEKKAEIGTTTKAKVAAILMRDEEDVKNAEKQADRAHNAKEKDVKARTKAKTAEKTNIENDKEAEKMLKLKEDNLATRVAEAKEEAKELEKEKAQAKAAVERARHGGVSADQAKQDFKTANQEAEKAKARVSQAKAEAEKALDAFTAAKKKTQKAAESGAANLKAADTASEAQKTADYEEKQVSELSQQQEKAKKQQQALVRDLAEKYSKARQATKDAQRAVNDFIGAESKSSAEADLKRLEDEAQSSKSTLSNLKGDDKAKAAAEARLKKIKQTCTMDEKQESETHMQVKKVHRELKEGKAKQQSSTAQELEDAKQAVSVTADKLKVAEREAAAARKAKAEASRMVDDAGDDEEAKGQAQASLDKATLDAAQAEKSVKSAQGTHDNAVKASKKAQEAADQHDADHRLKISELEKRRDAADKKAQAAESQVKECIKMQQQATKDLEELTTDSKKGKLALEKLRNAEKGMAAAKKRVTEASEQDVDREAAKAKLKAAKKEEQAAKEALTQQKEANAVVDKKMRIEMDAASQKAEHATRDAAKDRARADKAKSTAEDLKVAADDAAVEELESKSQDAADKLQAAKKALVETRTTAIDAKATYTKATDADAAKQKAAERLNKANKKAGNAEERALSLMAKQKKAEEATQDAAEKVRKDKKQAQEEQKQLETKDKEAAQKMEEADTKVKEAEEKREKAETVVSEEDENEAAKELAQASLDEATKEERNARKVKAAAKQAQAKAAGAVRMAKSTERNQKTDIQKARIKIDKKKREAAMEEKQVEQMIRKSERAKDKAQEYSDDANEFAKVKGAAQEELIKATKEAAKANELSSKADIKKQEAKKSAPKITEAQEEANQIHVDIQITDGVKTAKKNQAAAKEGVEKAQAKSREMNKAAERAKKLAEEKARYQVKKAEEAVCRAKAVLDQSSADLSEDPSTTNIQAMKEAEAALGRNEITASDANKAAVALGIKIVHVPCPQRAVVRQPVVEQQAAPPPRPREIKHKMPGKFKGDINVLIPFYCTRPKYEHLCKFYKDLRRKGRLHQAIPV